MEELHEKVDCRADRRLKKGGRVREKRSLKMCLALRNGLAEEVRKNIPDYWQS